MRFISLKPNELAPARTGLSPPRRKSSRNGGMIRQIRGDSGALARLVWQAIFESVEMHATLRAEIPWTPATDEERAAVLSQMDRLLNSRHFRNSRRYPALLEYIIRQTLAGNSDSLKERVLGIAVFHRPPDYDANADPIVRVTAGEIRKRIAQYYHDEETAGEIQIDLRPGSYVPEFHLVAPVASTSPEPRDAFVADTPLQDPLTTAGSSLSSTVGHRLVGSRRAAAAVVTALLAVAVIASVIHWHRADDQRSQMWYPLLNSPAPVLLVVGQPHIAQTETPSTISAYEHTPEGELELPDAIAMAHLCAMLDTHHHLYQIIGVNSASLSDLRKGPAILVGGSNNPWTLRILRPLRFSISSAADPSAGGSAMLQIVDRKHHPGSPWTVDFQQPVSSITHDYAIIARFQANMTDGVVMVVAGLGSGGTESASKFINSASYMSQLVSQAPRNWRSMNMEAVLETEVIGGRAGHPHIIATEFW
jgi:hypothetical protein